MATHCWPGSEATNLKHFERNINGEKEGRFISMNQRRRLNRPSVVARVPIRSFYHFYALPTLAFAKSFFFFCYLFPVLLSCLPIWHFNVLLQSCLFVILILTCVFFFSTLPLSTAHQWWHFSLLLVFFTLWDGLLNSKSVADGLFLQYHSWFVCSFSFAFQNLHLLLINSALSPQAKKA